MKISQYNKSRQSSLIVSIVILLIIGYCMPSVSAQQVGSITLNRNIEKFKEYRTLNRERAWDYAKLIVDDLDSTTITLDAAIVYARLISSLSSTTAPA